MHAHPTVQVPSGKDSPCCVSEGGTGPATSMLQQEQARIDFVLGPHDSSRNQAVGGKEGLVGESK